MRAMVGWVLSLWTPFGLHAQFALPVAWQDSLSAYWSRMERTFADSARSPLTPQDRATFIHLDRFDPDPAHVVEARFKPTSRARPFAMRTTTDRLPLYQEVGTLVFTLQGRKCRLKVYRNVELVKSPAYERHLFVPFTDPTNGESTYGGGRYLDLEGPLADRVMLDLNRAYNPYCAYNSRYSCPIPPRENHLEVPVRAGVRHRGH